MIQSPFVKDNQFEIFKLNARGFSIEQIQKLFELDKYFTNQNIGEKGELIQYILSNEEITYNDSFIKNVEVVLKYQNNPVFNRISERLRCNSIADYYKFILSARELENFCNAYTDTTHNNKSINYPRDEKGHIVLEPKDYLLTNIPFKGTREGRWYLLSNKTRVFIKNLCTDREAYSELISEQIAKQMGIPRARYDLVTIGGLPKIASVNILETGEELLHGHDILEVQSVKDISYICRSIERTLNKRYPNITKEKMQEIKEDFLKITIFDKIIGNWDRNPGNWGLILSPDDKSVRMAPEFDNNRALNMHMFDYDKDMHLNEDHNIKTLLEYCLANFSNPDNFLEFVNTCVKNVSVRKSAENIKTEKGIQIPQAHIIDMEFQVHGRGTQAMRHWLEEKGYPRKPIVKEDMCL